ncbi:MAG: FAD-dependent 5-carboxymethylaminomethyl-2-thiouridine(34) oxidoreductase MnmC, partial [Rickettsiales bacterium]|nr:FAD-dependent 5-carboxymethylaminomethyl-2-thiouridine(34) oxidoreductase MnmC [Rickettsiales bacterium]
LTAAGGTASTFSAAAAVRQGLAEAGFSVERVAGYGRKRHMTIARKAGVNAAPASKPANVTVIGGGIAGVSVARALADRGVQVTLLEERSALAMGGSGTPAAMLFPRLAKQWTAAARADWAALYHLRRCWLPSSASDGLMQIAKNQRGKRDAEGWAALPAQLGMPEAVMRACDAAELSERVGITIKHGGLFIADSQLISMPDLVLKMAEHPFIKIINGVGVESLEKTGDGWLLMTNCGIMNASHVIVACGSTALRLLPFLTLPLVPVRGQLTRLPTSEPLKAQRLPLGYGGYLSPPDASGHHWLGATFDRGDCSSELSAASHAENIGKLGEIMPALNVMDTTTAALSGWVGHRMTSPDRLPLIGAAPSSVDADVSGLYLSLAHGSRGALSGPLGGEILAAAICQLPTPVEQSVLGTYDPARFQARAKRSFLHSSKE